MQFIAETSFLHAILRGNNLGYKWWRVIIFQLVVGSYLYSVLIELWIVIFVLPLLRMHKPFTSMYVKYIWYQIEQVEFGRRAQHAVYVFSGEMF